MTWFTLVYSALFALCVAYTIWYAAVREIGSARTSIYSNLVPIVAMLTAVVFLGESLGPRKIIGAAAVLAGVALTRMSATKIVAPAE
jgi:drug/metabolite transporter (DMT)-like permease